MTALSVRKHAYIYIPQPPPCPLPPKKVEEVDEIHASKDTHPPDTKRRPPPFSAQVRPDTRVHVSDMGQLGPVTQLSPAVCKL